MFKTEQQRVISGRGVGTQKPSQLLAISPLYRNLQAISKNSPIVLAKGLTAFDKCLHTEVQRHLWVSRIGRKMRK
jgi:hypothetical protein